ncbi:flagellar assembly protein FliH [Paraliobacillus sediminis]|uniref:flagellar assembly protein FliH n=1 Tax=Paraliobacillus sediminis TaxID=1885916 RepID=UPI0013C2EAFC|nr:flagellar assembly protein FliH [Paraliobacillus sediminis]
MSNQLGRKITPSKVIGIKPLEIRQDFTEENLLDKKANIEIQLQQAKQQLQQTIEQTDHLFTDTQLKIKNEEKNWQEEKQRWIEEAKQIGYQDGFQVGKEESLKEYQALLDQAQEIIKLAEEEAQIILSRSEPTILRLGIAAASKIVQHKLVESDAYVEITKKVLKEVLDQPSIRIFSNPRDFQTLQKYESELRLIIDTKADLIFYPDESLSEGDCIVETPFGKIDASVDSQLETLRHALLDIAEGINRES